MESFDYTFIFFTYTISFFAFFLLRMIFTFLRPSCHCRTCKSFLGSKWSENFTNLCDWYTHLLRNSPTGTIHVHVLGNIITTNPDNVEYILKTRFENYPKGKAFSAILGDLLGKGIFNVDGDSWRFQRKMASMEINSLSTRSYAYEIVSTEISDRLVPLCSHFRDSRRVLDLQDVFQRFSFDNICRFSFGWDPNCLNESLPTSELAAVFDLASKLSAERAMTASPLIWKLKKGFNVGTEKKLQEAIKKIHVLAEQVIMQKRGKDEKDLLSRFMATTCDKEYLRDIIVSFLLAGRDTVASALTSLFWMMSRHPEVAEGIRAEADRVVGGGAPSVRQLREMHYLHATVHECMRLYPPVQFDSKFCVEDDVLPDGTVVKGGTRVTYHPYAMGRMEKVWGSNSLEFKPERWLDDHGCFKPESPFKYPVFQAGPRVCLGKEMAIMEIKSVAVSLLQKFDFQILIPNCQQLKFMPGLTATVRGGLPVLVRERTRDDLPNTFRH